MASWSRKRKFWIAVGVILVLAVLAGVPLYLYLDREPTCFDGVQNQDETGVDCGGSCMAVCIDQVQDPILHWQRVFSAAPGIVYAVASVENPNPEAGLEELIYRFRIFDEENILIAERFGKTFAAPGERLAIFEGGIRVGDREPARVFFEFNPELDWKRLAIPAEDLPNIAVRNQRLGQTASGNPRLTVELANSRPLGEQNVEVVAILFDANENAIAASATFVEEIGALESEIVSFTWPEQFSSTPVRIEIIPRVNIF